MKDEKKLTKPSLLDRLVFLRSGIQRVVALPEGPSGNLRYICTERGSHYLKASYPGNIQYHQVNKTQIEVLLSEMSKGDVQ